jgi:hypothetical protein
MDFDIGSNHYRNASPSIEIEGVPHLSFEHNRRYNEMTLRGFVYDQKGNMVSKIAESSLAINIQGEFEMRTDPSVVKLLRRETEEVLLEVKFLDKDHVQIHKAKLYSIKGRPFEVTPKHWKLGDDAPRTGEDVDCGGNAASLK